MNNIVGELADLIRMHIRCIDEYAEYVLLDVSSSHAKDEFKLYVFTPGTVSYGLEQEFKAAGVKVNVLSGIAMGLNVYSKQEWHKHWANKPIYKTVNSEGIVL